MKTVPTFSSKHPLVVSLDAIQLYYASGCRVIPVLYTQMLDGLSYLERQNKVCLTPNAILERYHLNLRRRIASRIHKIARFIG